MGSTQYDDIVSAYNEIYDDLQNLPAGELEQANLHAALKDRLQDKRILELGCGSGHYSRLLLEWGAHSVLGIDISARMVNEARSRAKDKGISGSQLSYHVADVSTGLDLEDKAGPFDLVVGTWLLNYAPSAKDMEGMWRTVFNNLVTGGIFVGLTIPPPLGDREELDRAHRQEWALYGTSGYVKREVAEGFEVHTALGSPARTAKVEFDNYYLRHEAFTRSSKAAGFGETFEWLPFVLPESVKTKKPVGYWNRAVLNPHFRICRLEKKTQDSHSSRRL